MPHQLPLTTADSMRAAAGKSINDSDARDKDKPTAASPSRSVLGYPMTTAVGVLWLVLTYIGYVAFTRDQARNGAYGCEMAYMYPNYHRVEWEGSAAERYSVYLYREGGSDPEKPMGMPVVFLPGNAGSFKQARSIASSASRLFYSNNQETDWPHPLDFFAYDFNEDFSAFHAPTLEDQGAFVAATIPRILEQYPASNRPEQVLLVGHSMGGIVARLAALHMNGSTIGAIVTMSTPHAIPPVAFDHKIDSLYAKINAAPYSRPSPLLISICGGVSDTQIISESCALPLSLVGPEDGFAVFSTDMPGVWTGVEHQAMVWCDQVRWRVARALLGMTTKSRESNLYAAREWLASRSVSPNERKGTAGAGTEVDVVAPNMSFLVRIPDTTDKIVAHPPVRVACCDGARCSEPRWTAHAVPRPSNPNDPFPFPGEGIKVTESVIIVDVYDLPVRGTLKLETPQGAEVVGGAYDSYDVGSSWRSLASKTPAHISLTFNRPVSSLLAWKLKTTTGSCSGPPPVIHHESVASTGNEPSYESRFYPTANRDGITLHSHISGAPFHAGRQQSRSVHVHIYQQPLCSVESATLSLDLMATVAKAMLRFRIAAFTWAAGWVAVFVFRQLGEYFVSGNMPPLKTVMEGSMRQNLAVVCGTLVGAPVLQHILGLFWSAEQFFLGSTEFLHVPFAFMVAFWSLGLVIVVQRLQTVVIGIAGRFWHKSEHVHHRSTATSTMWTAASRLVPAALLLILVKTFIPWRMAFVVLYVIQFSVVARSASAREEQARHNLVASVFLLMTFLLPLTVPAIAVWGRNLWNNHGHPFASDHAVLPLVPVLLVVQLGSTDGGVTRNKIIIKAAQAVALLLAITSVTISARRSYLLLSAADGVFLALAAVLFEGL